MRIPNFLRTREWVILRRLLLLILIIVIGFRTWGGSLLAPFQSANGARDIAITRTEFRPDIPGAKPAWIISVRNNSSRFAYDRIQVEAIYTDNTGAVLLKDNMTLHQKLVPGQEEVIATTDFKERPGATNGTMKVLQADVLK